jgi:hypothetical protein
MSKSDRDSWVMASPVLDPDIKGAMSFGLGDGAALGVRYASTFHQCLSEIRPSRHFREFLHGLKVCSLRDARSDCVFEGNRLPQQESFIGDDEVEFIHRMLLHGKVPTGTDSAISHSGPSIDHTLTDWKQYHSVGNEVANSREYFPPIKIPKLDLLLRVMEYKLPPRLLASEKSIASQCSLSWTTVTVTFHGIRLVFDSLRNRRGASKSNVRES